ncbi:hypothetical protein C4U87_00800 [Clostridioides difficile]
MKGNYKRVKVRVVNYRNVADFLVWLGYSYTKDEDNNFVFERNYGFDLAFKALHSTKSFYKKERWEGK